MEKITEDSPNFSDDSLLFITIRLDVNFSGHEGYSISQCHRTSSAAEALDYFYNASETYIGSNFNLYATTLRTEFINAIDQFGDPLHPSETYCLVNKSHGEIKFISLFEQAFLDRIKEEKKLLEDSISLHDLLPEIGYTRLTERLYVKENSSEIIVVDKKNDSQYKNFELKSDKGTVADFISNRSLKSGEIIPNSSLRAKVSAIAQMFHFTCGEDESLQRLPAIRIVTGKDQLKNKI